MFFKLFKCDCDRGNSQIEKLLQQILHREETIMTELDNLTTAVTEAVAVEHEALVKVQDDVTKLAADVIQIADLVAQLAAANSLPAVAALTTQLTTATAELKAGLDAVVVPVPPPPVV